MTPANFRYLLGSGGRPLLTADDITDSAGEKRILPGRSGPPGADYNTLPELKPQVLQMLSGYWRENNTGDMRRLEQALAQPLPRLSFANGQHQSFFANAACARRWGANCAFQ